MIRLPRALRRWLWHLTTRSWTRLVADGVVPLALDMVGGIGLHGFSRQPIPASAVSRTVAALELIAATDPRRFKRLERDIAVIVLSDQLPPKARGAHMPGSRCCYLALDAVNAGGVATLALTIVHEAVHARLDGLYLVGQSYYARVERRCVREELAFAARLPADQYADVASRVERAKRNLGNRKAVQRSWLERVSRAT